MVGVHLPVMRTLRFVVLLEMLLGATLSGCAISPAQQEATRRAWADRDAVRARECERARGMWVAGGCIYGGGM